MKKKDLTKLIILTNKLSEKECRFNTLKILKKFIDEVNSLKEKFENDLNEEELILNTKIPASLIDELKLNIKDFNLIEELIDEDYKCKHCK